MKMSTASTFKKEQGFSVLSASELQLVDGGKLSETAGILAGVTAAVGLEPVAGFLAGIALGAYVCGN